MENSTRAIYVAKPEYITELCNELGLITNQINDLIFSSKLDLQVCFAQDIWLNPCIVPFQSISEAAKILRNAGKFWYLHPTSHIRRSRLIEEQLRTYSLNPCTFPLEKTIPEIGVFSLLEQNKLLYCTKRARQFPDGNILFIEDKINPPNRAYLKLWEALTLLGRYPAPNDTVIDLGASPGGWTYVMQSFNAQVTAVDKAPLAPHIASLPQVSFLQQSGFALEPAQLETTVDWLLSDIACYPKRAYSLITKWIKSQKVKQMIITIKLQGTIDFAIINQFKAIPNSRMLQLSSNKHEVTFFYPGF